MSTVGYGDVTVSKEHRWSVFIGAMYMLLAILVAITAFAAAAEAAYSFTLVPLTRMTERLVRKARGSIKHGQKYIMKSKEENRKDKKLLYQYMRRLKCIKLAEIFGQLVFLNLLGMFVARAFVNSSSTDVESQQWDWMTTFYWAIQTTTTVG